MSQPPSRPPPEDPEEISQADDAVVGRAIRGSLVALAVLVAGAGVAYGVLRTRKPAGPVRVTTLAAPLAAPQAARARVPAARFTEVSREAGLAFRHETGAAGEKLLPETMGGGVAFLDVEGDGDADLLLVNSRPWPWTAAGDAGRTAPGVALYRNDSAGGNLRLTDITAGSGMEAPFYGMSVAVGDYDNDGRPDVLLGGVGGSRLFHNEGGGRFRDVTAAAGVAGEASDWASAAAWLDLDNDGDLDLFAARYVRWSREIDAEVGYKIDGTTRAYGPPMNFQGTFPRLYRNDGGGRFTDISAASGVQVKNPATGVPAAKSLGVSPADLNRDGWVDLVVANDTVQNFVFLNQRNGTFREAGAESGLAFDSYGNTRGAMGIDAARFTPDGRLAFAIGNFANEMTALYVEQPGGTPELPLYADEALSWGVGGPSRDPLKFGVVFLDYDLDGRLDLLSVNGHLEAEISKVQHGQRYEQAAQLFWNGGDAGFVAVTTNEAGADLFRPIVGRGSAYADLDG
ncbi:MAG: FG-GAP repeat domain-containing protein, partial [Verrucomicrobiota bacterium]